MLNGRCLMSILCIGLVFFCFHLLMQSVMNTCFINFAPNNYSKSENWPIRVTKTPIGYTELTLDYQLDSSNALVEMTVQDNLVMSHGAGGKALTFRDLVRIPDSQWKEYIPREAYLVNQQAINLVDTVDKLIHKRPIPADPINNATIRFRRLTKPVCNPDDPESSNYDVIIVVKSGIANFDKRQFIREIVGRFQRKTTRRYGPKHVGLVFAVGKTRGQEDNLFDRHGQQVRLVRSGGEHLNPDSLRKIRDNFEQEFGQYDDLLVGDYEDTYFNLTVKMIHTFNWAATFCRLGRPNFVFIDDDDKAVLDSVIRIFLRRPKVNTGSLMYGYHMLKNPTYRFGKAGYEKWALLKEEFPWPKYPPYTSGRLLLARFADVERLALGMWFTQQFHIDDCWLGLVATRLDIPFHNVQILFG